MTVACFSCIVEIPSCDEKRHIILLQRYDLVIVSREYCRLLDLLEVHSTHGQTEVTCCIVLSLLVILNTTLFVYAMTSKPYTGARGSSFLVERDTKSPKREETSEGHSRELILHSAINRGSEPHPSTSRALVLRNAAYGTGELAFGQKISGQEKLLLLASEPQCHLCAFGSLLTVSSEEDMTTNTIRAPFRLDELLKKAESQLGGKSCTVFNSSLTYFPFAAHLDEISNLKDKDFFCDDILATISSRIEATPDRNGIRRPPIDDTHWVASVVGCRYVLLINVLQ